MKRSPLALLTAAAVLLAVPGISSAASPAVGTATTSISILSLTASRKTVNLGAGTGFASTDQVKQNLGALGAKASMSFTAAQLLDAISTPKISVETTSDKTSDVAADGTSPLLDVPTASGSLTISGMRADVDNAVPSAKSTLGQVTLDANVFDGLVLIQGIKMALTNESNPTEAKSFQGVEISNVAVLPLSEIIDRATDLSADDLIDLAAGFGGDATADELAAVNVSKASMTSVVNALSPGLLDTNSSAELMLACGAPLQQVICDLPDVATAIAALQSAVDTLKTALGALSLVSLKDVIVGTLATATDTSSASSANLSWGAVKVAGIEVPVTPGDLQASVASVNATLSQLQTLMGTLTQGLGGLKLEIAPPTTNATHDQSGAYYHAVSSIKPLGVVVSLPAAAGIKSPLDVKGQLFTVAGDAEHRPSILDAPPNPPLANTGANAGWVLMGLLMIVGAYRLRRWLGDAA
ncbi:MAG: hypothetical protein ABIS18_09345 [Actinomycetota bacterium]